MYSYLLNNIAVIHSKSLTVADAGWYVVGIAIRKCIYVYLDTKLLSDNGQKRVVCEILCTEIKKQASHRPVERLCYNLYNVLFIGMYV